MKEIFVGENLTLEDAKSVAFFYSHVAIAENSKIRIHQSRSFLENQLQSGQVNYGINTGFGSLSSVRVSDSDLEQLQINLIRSHAVGVGEPLEHAQVRLMLLLRAHSLAKGYSGVRLELIQRILDFLNSKIHPYVPSKGSVGASGDLAPLAHLALPILGEGYLLDENQKKIPAHQALKQKNIEPMTLKAKEGLALINGTQFMTALGVEAFFDAKALLNQSIAVAALSCEALRGSRDAFDSKIHQIRPHEGQRKIAEKMRFYLGSKEKSEIAISHLNCDRVQDSYSLRCIPQVLGVVYDTLNFVEKILNTEVQSVTDNPLIFAGEEEILSGGNFHGQYCASALDYLGIAVCEIGSIAEQRIQKLLNPVFSQLPAFLTKNPGLNSGLMIVQYTAAALVSENKTLAHPASVDSIPTNNDKEDHVSMGPWAARKLLMIIANVRKIVAIESLCAFQAMSFLRPLKSTPDVEEIVSRLDKIIHPIEDDRAFSDDIEKIELYLKQNSFL